MKILIPILLALFLSSHASANDYSIKDVCKYIEDQVTSNYGMVAMHDEWAERELGKFKDIDKEDKELIEKTNDKRNKLTKISKIFKETMVKEAKTYHYLDCSDFRSESGRIE
jgi:hypothetical protein